MQVFILALEGIIMKAVHFDAKTGNPIEAHNVGSMGGVTGFISWRRLCELFRDGKEIRDNEALLSFQIDERGITYRVGDIT
jgi:hypothetical protein